MKYTLAEIKRGEKVLQEVLFYKMFKESDRSFYHILKVIMEVLKEYEYILITGGEETLSVSYLEKLLEEFSSYWK